MKLPIYQVDAFADAPFRGNPAAVCLLQNWLDDELLQAIASENNLSETAFVVADGNNYAIRWFTPGVEADLCGHATLAAAYVLKKHVCTGASQIDFSSRSGPLHVNVADDWLVLDFPAATLKKVRPSKDVATALGCMPVEYYESDYALAVLETQAQVQALQPDYGVIAQHFSAGIIVTAPGDPGENVDIVSRYFAPAAGIDEDPVTGSAHCILMPYWAERLGRNKLKARQVSARGGELRCELAGDRVKIAGQVVPYLVGEIEV